MLRSQTHYLEREEDKEERKRKEKKEGMKNITVPIFKNPSTVRLRKGLPMSIATSTFGVVTEPENLLRGIVSSLSHNTLRQCVTGALSLSLTLGRIDLLILILDSCAG
jgi:hypothetical protein